MSRTATLIAGIPAENRALFHKVRFEVGDPAAWLALDLDGKVTTHFIVRDIENERAREHVAVDNVAAPADFTPTEGLSGDRATATAQSVVECLRQNGVTKVTSDRTLPLVYSWHIQQAGIALDYSPELGVVERRCKIEQEIDWLREAQGVTEDAITMTMDLIASATTNAAGQLVAGGNILTSELVRSGINAYLSSRGYSSPAGSIVATRPHSADCHMRGSGPLVTGEAIIVDIFPQNDKTKYCGDCTRTIVHGDPSDEVVKMHTAVVAAIEAAIAKCVIGNTADDVHGTTKATLQEHGYPFLRGQISDTPVMPHGTGHGVGLEIHEPILLDDNGGTLLSGEALTVEPGLYSRQYGGVRVEDMIVTTENGPINLNKLQYGLTWK
ncbi:MAG: M24 family metallopeptidase [Aureliella sp.]